MRSRPAFSRFLHGAALTGIAVRQALRLYIITVVAVMLLLLLVAWAIDLSRNLEGVEQKAAAMQTALASLLIPYLFFRTADIITRLLPIACLVGVFAAELLRRYRLESVILASAGFSPLQGCAALLAFGALAGPFQAQLETNWRPAAVFAQVDLDVGSYAARFHRGAYGEPAWFLGRDFAIRAMPIRSDPPELRRVELYRGYEQGRLQLVAVSPRAKPSAIRNLWVFEDALVCNVSRGPGCERTKGASISLDLAPEQVTYFDVPAFYVPNGPLQNMAGNEAAQNFSDIRTAIWRRRIAGLLPFAFAFLGASLAQTVWSGRTASPVAVVIVCFCGYLTLVALKVFWALGEIGTLPGFWAASLPVALALAGGAVIQFLRS